MREAGPPDGGRGDVRVEIVDSPAALAGLKPEWTDLLGDSASESPFLTWEWLHTWWEHFSGKRQLRVLAARRGGRLVGLAPLAVRARRACGLVPVRRLEFLGTGSVGSDYLDVILRRGSESEALGALTGVLASGRDAIALSQVNADSGHARGLAEGLRRLGWGVVRTTTNACPFIDLSGHAWGSYLATLGSEHRYAFRRRARSLHRGFRVEFLPVRSEPERREALSVLFALHRARWKGRGGSDAFHTPGLLAFHEAVSRMALANGWLRLFVLRLDGAPAAALYGFLYRRVFYFYQSGLDPAYGQYSPGLVTLGLAIRTAIEEGAREFDLLHGQEGYKLHWTRRQRELVRFELYPPLARAAFDRRVTALRRAAGRVVRGALASVRAAGCAPG